MRTLDQDHSPFIASEIRSMRLVCPNCATHYEVPDSLVLGTPGRPVRCANCAHQWVPIPAIPLPDAPEVPTDLPAEDTGERGEPALADHPTGGEVVTSLDRPPIRADQRPTASAPARAPRSPLVPILWAASLVLLAGLVWAGGRYRKEIVRAWPPSARIYVALGLHD